MQLNDTKLKIDFCLFMCPLQAIADEWFCVIFFEGNARLIIAYERKKWYSKIRMSMYVCIEKCIWNHHLNSLLVPFSDVFSRTNVRSGTLYVRNRCACLCRYYYSSQQFIWLLFSWEFINRKKKELLRSSSSIEFSRWHSAVIFKNTQHNPIRFLIVSFGCVTINDDEGILGVFSHFISLFCQKLTGHSIKISQKLKHTTKHPK